MAKTLSNTGITDGQLARAAQVTQSINAFTGGEAYDITISGSLTVTGSTALSGNLAIPGFPDVSASLASAGGSTDSFPFTGSAAISGSLSIDGPVGHITASGNISASGDLSIQGFPSVSASLAAATGSTPTLQEVTDQGSSTTTAITASIISASRDIITNTLTASGLIYPTTDGVDGQVIVTDGAGNLSFGHGEKLHLQVRNDDSVDITAGTPIYSTGEVGGSERIKVRIAQASDASKMPAIGVVETTLTTTGGTKDGFAIINGIYNTNITPVSGTPALGDNVYIHANGGVTTIKPSGSNLIQNIGTVLKTNGTVIQGMKVSSIDRTNDVPNLLDNTIFFGSGSDQTQQIHISGALDQTIINNITASGNISASGDLSIQGFPSVSASLAAGTGGDSFPYTGSAIISGSLIVTGSTGLINPDQTITLRNTSGSTFRAFGTDGPGVFLDINQNDTGLGNTSLMFGNINPDIGGGLVIPMTGLLANYVTGSDGASGSVSFFAGQRDLTAAGGQIANLISLEYEPGELLLNNDPEITLKIGESDTNSYRESIDGRYINRNTGETAQLIIGETDSTNAQQVNIKNNIIGTSGSYEIFTTNKSPNNTSFKQGMISGSGETGLSYFSLNYNEYTSTTSSLDLRIGDQGYSNLGPRFEYTYAKNSNTFNDQNTLIKIGHDTEYGGTVNITEYRNNSTSSIVGFFTGSAGYDNQQPGALPFVIFNNIAGVRNTTSPAFVIEQTFPETGSTPNPTFRIDHNGSISKVGGITSTGNISTTGAITTTNITASIISASGNIFGETGSFSHLEGNSPITVGDSITFQQAITASNNISASGDIIGNQITGSKLAITNGGSLPQPSGYSGLSSIVNGGAFFQINEETDRVFGIRDDPDGADILRIDTDPDQFLIDPINNGYKVGIGTSTPPEKLTVQGNISASGDIITDDLKGSSARSLDISNINKIFNVDGNDPSIMFTGDYNVSLGDADFGNSGTTIEILESSQRINLYANELHMIGDITASGNISASGHLAVDEIVSNGGFNLYASDEDLENGPFSIFNVSGDFESGNDAIIRIGDSNFYDTNSHIKIEPIEQRVSFRDLDTTISGSITATGNISTSVDIIGNNITANGAVTASAIGNPGDEIRVEGTIRLGESDNFILIENGGDTIFNTPSAEFRDDSNSITILLQGDNSSETTRIQMGDPDGDTFGFQLDLDFYNQSAHFNGLNITSSKNIKADGHGLFQAGKPIVTHTSSPISSSLANAGKYHIVGGNLTASIVINSSTPVGAEYEFFQSSSTGQFLFESASGTTVISKNGSMRLAQQGSSAVLKKVSSTTFHLMGDLT